MCPWPESVLEHMDLEMSSEILSTQIHTHKTYFGFIGPVNDFFIFLMFEHIYLKIIGNLLLQKYSSHLRGEKRHLVLEPNMNNRGPGMQIQIVQNSISNVIRFMKLYNKENSSQDTFQMY